MLHRAIPKYNLPQQTDEQALTSGIDHSLGFAWLMNRGALILFSQHNFSEDQSKIGSVTSRYKYWKEVGAGFASIDQRYSFVLSHNPRQQEISLKAMLKFD